MKKRKRRGKEGSHKHTYLTTQRKKQHLLLNSFAGEIKRSELASKARNLVFLKCLPVDYSLNILNSI